MTPTSEPLKPPIVEDTARNPIGWIVLGVLLLLTIVLSMGSDPKEKPSRFKDHDEAQSLLRISMSSESLLQSLGTTAGRSQAKAHDTSVEALDAPISSLVQEAKGDPMAAMLYAEMRTFQKRSVPESRLESLKTSTNPVDRAFYAIYASPKLSIEEAKKLVAELPNDPFVYRAAKVQAFEKAGDRDALTRLIPPSSAAMLLGLEVVAWPFIGICFAIWYVLFRRLRDGKHKFLGLPLDPATPHDADRLALRAAQIFVAFVVLYSFVPMIPIPGWNSTEKTALAGLILLGCTWLFQRIPLDGKFILLETLGISRKNLGRNVVLGIVAFIAEFPVALFLGEVSQKLLQWLPKAPQNPAADAMMHTNDWRTTLSILLVGAVVAPIWEEMVFRGLLFPALKRIWGMVPAVAVSSFLFASVHIQGPTMWLPLAGLGAASCFMSYQTRSLVPSIVMHGMHNFAIFVVILMVR